MADLPYGLSIGWADAWRRILRMDATALFLAVMAFVGIAGAAFLVFKDHTMSKKRGAALAMVCIAIALSGWIGDHYNRRWLLEVSALLTMAYWYIVGLHFRDKIRNRRERVR